MADIPRLERRPEARVFSVETLLQYAQEGRVRTPAFASELRWRSSEVLAFFDSIYRGFPVGSLVFVRRAAAAGTLHFGPMQVKAPGVADALIAVDGQQRLTALAAALLHPEPRPRSDLYAVWFDLEAKEFRRLDALNPPLHWIPLNVVADPLRLLISNRECQSERPSLRRRSDTPRPR